MQVIDSFLFSEVQELDMLLVKFNLEKHIVSTWLLLESPYTFQAEYKGLSAKELLQNDERFSEFVDRIIIINPDDNFKPLHGSTNEENKNFDRENAQRAMCLDFVLKNFSDEDWLIISDTDESIDFSDKKRQEFVLSILEDQNMNIFKLRRQRYWYDFDNMCFLPNIHIPLVRVGLLRHNNQYINARHFDHIHKINPDLPVAFEYSYCFRSFEEVMRKKRTYSHTGFCEASVRSGLACNHWPRSPNRGEVVGQEPYDFFEKVELTEENSPKYVRDNLYWLRTNIVADDYKVKRKEVYNV